MAPDIAIAHLPALTDQKPLKVLDPMCGSGTVLSAAVTEGHAAYGFDLDPLAVLMSTVATSPLDGEAYSAAVNEVITRASIAGDLDLPWDDRETTTFAEYWFGKVQRQQLTRLSAAIAEEADLSIRNALRVALSRIIVTKAPKASLAADTSHSRPHRVLEESTYNCIAGFKASSDALGKLLAQRTLNGTAHVARGDSRLLTLSDESIDLVITSPPYLNAIDYLRGHRLSLIWMGHTIPELREVRSTSIGAERALRSDAAAGVADIVDAIRLSVPHPDLLPLSTITRYAHDLFGFASEMMRVCSAGAQVVTVIGNSTLRGNYIENDRVVRTAYEQAGFEVTERIERELPENRRYLPVNAGTAGVAMAKRMRTEIVLTAAKN